MNNINKFKIILAILTLHICLSASLEPSGSDHLIALTHVNILPMDTEVALVALLLSFVGWLMQAYSLFDCGRHTGKPVGAVILWEIPVRNR